MLLCDTSSLLSQMFEQSQLFNFFERAPKLLVKSTIYLFSYFYMSNQQESSFAYPIRLLRIMRVYNYFLFELLQLDELRLCVSIKPRVLSTTLIYSYQKTKINHLQSVNNINYKFSLRILSSNYIYPNLLSQIKENLSLQQNIPFIIYLLQFFVHANEIQLSNAQILIGLLLNCLCDYYYIIRFKLIIHCKFLQSILNYYSMISLPNILISKSFNLLSTYIFKSFHVGLCKILLRLFIQDSKNTAEPGIME
ncbi:unnamed protein product (macronuclear) [Paramecium tetraurelia]|uniref:Transmembrane protein n=1 Tax=Paramecium tetraurelia TaxID=5888 RepID=A0BDE0_PARTE|nr:uncharacterized protein GSPATT00027585001 [Paramecium tetraurelia]CAK56557.1 unnamed protein product [Paramecium tetraurelia]|eukprot:XP_001423955.1 hypothetical protein (macronuclear) [Paramecium tetraurelia strain d4-2]